MNKAIHRGYSLVNPCPEPDAMHTVAIPSALADELNDYPRLAGLSPAQVARWGLRFLLNEEKRQRAELAKRPPSGPGRPQAPG